MGSVIELSARAYDAAYAQLISQTIVQRAEQFINEISNNLAKSRLAFAQSEHDIVEEKLQNAKLALIDFQTKYNVLDPNAEGCHPADCLFIRGDTGTERGGAEHVKKHYV